MKKEKDDIFNLISEDTAKILGDLNSMGKVDLIMAVFLEALLGNATYEDILDTYDFCYGDDEDEID